MNKYEAYKDKNNPDNSSKWHTGELCIEKDCINPAGTAWSPYWCVDCNIKRMERIDESFKEIQKTFKDPTYLPKREREFLKNLKLGNNKK